MDLKEAIYTRRAVREFTSQAVDQTTIRDLIDAAIQAPSAVNEQPWLFSVVRDKAILDWISDESKTYMLQNPPSGIRPQDIQELTNNRQFNILYCTCTYRDFECERQPMGDRELFFSRAKSDALRLRRGAGNLLDRICAVLARHP
jgi:nitroreductase